MIKFPEFPSIDLASLDLSRLDVNALPKIESERLTAAVRDAAYITVGLGVLAVQLLGQARDFTKVARQQVRGLVRSAA